MKYSITYSHLAWKDLQQIYDFIACDSPSAAQLFVDHLDEQVGRLSQFPHLGRFPKQDYLRPKGYRILVIGDYLVFYRAKPKEIKVDRVIHGKRRYEFLI